MVEEGSLLLVNLLSPISDSLIWTAPGGEVEFGETLEETVKREFKEETGLNIDVRELVHINELIEGEFHAIEFYYKVEKKSGKLKLGIDPELSSEDQILNGLAFKNKKEMQKLSVSPLFLRNELWGNL